MRIAHRRPQSMEAQLLALVGGLLLVGLTLFWALPPWYFEPHVRILPLTLRADLRADYSAEQRVAAIPAVSLSLIRQAVQDRQPSGSPADALRLLEAPVPTPTPAGPYRAPTLPPSSTLPTQVPAQPSPTPTPSLLPATPTLASTATASPTPSTTLDDRPTRTPKPTKTPKATHTPLPTQTPLPTATLALPTPTAPAYPPPATPPPTTEPPYPAP